jgi:hypothetical protein
MNIDQMHIEITQGVQRLASHIDYDLQKEEIDLHLNHVIKNFVLSHFTFSENKGFEIIKLLAKKNTKNDIFY